LARGRWPWRRWTRQEAVLCFCLISSILPIFFASIYGDKNNLSERGGALAVAVSFFNLFLDVGLGLKAFKFTIRDAGEVSLQNRVGAGNQLEDRVGNIEREFAKSNVNLVGVIRSIKVNDGQQARQSSYLAWSGAIGTLAWGFGDVFARVLVLIAAVLHTTLFGPRNAQFVPPVPPVVSDINPSLVKIANSLDGIAKALNADKGRTNFMPPPLQNYRTVRLLFLYNELTKTPQVDLTDPMRRQIKLSLPPSSDMTRLRILCYGYADSSGYFPANEKLALSRALNVANALVDDGVSREQITVDGYVETPQSDTSASNGRRVDIIFESTPAPSS